MIDQTLLLDGEIFKPIKGYKGLYDISNYGRVWSYHDNGCLKSTYVNSNGYVCVKLSKYGVVKSKRVNKLVAEAFCEKPEGWQPNWDAAHLDDNKLNNYYKNIAWQTRAENINTDHWRETNKNKIFSKVKCVETGEVFKSQAEAGRAIGKHRYGINNCLTGKQDTCGGYHWQRVYEED